jgi:sugar O-acyltransferase (sialic acid O-acetyltransferase NeuD family)
MKTRLVIFGNSAFAEIADEYFTSDSPYEVVAFTVHERFIQEKTMRGRPVLPYESIESYIDPNEHSLYAAITYQQLNRLRAEIANDAKLRGFELASYVSSHAFVWRNVKMGEHCFIFESNVVQPFVEPGENVILWSGNHIGHHSTIRRNTFVSSHVVVSGFVTIGDNCFLGVNSTIGNNVEVGRDSWISPSVAITKSVNAGTLLSLKRPEPHRLTTYDFFKVSVPEGDVTT